MSILTVMRQDPTHPTGVAETTSHLQAETIAARERKADAAVEMYVEKDKTLKQICKKLGYPSEPACLAAIESRMAYHLRFNPRNQAAMRDMASRRLERLTRITMKKAEDSYDPEQLRAVSETRSTIMDWVKLNGLAAPQQVVITNPADEAITALAAQIVNRGRPAIEAGSVFDGDPDDPEVKALEQRRKDTPDIVEGEVLEDEAGLLHNELDEVDAG